jgi:hypothetical protein
LSEVNDMLGKVSWSTLVLVALLSACGGRPIIAVGGGRGGDAGAGVSGGCGAGGTRCGETCAILASDPRHCGACGNACATGQVCDLGRCAASCSAALMACAGACVDLKSSDAHCGSCGAACGTGTSCAMGTCACPAGQT